MYLVVGVVVVSVDFGFDSNVLVEEVTNVSELRIYCQDLFSLFYLPDERSLPQVRPGYEPFHSSGSSRLAPRRTSGSPLFCS